MTGDERDGGSLIADMAATLAEMRAQRGRMSYQGIDQALVEKTIKAMRLASERRAQQAE